MSEDGFIMHVLKEFWTFNTKHCIGFTILIGFPLHFSTISIIYLQGVDRDC